jgi:hypothetical protein
MNLDETKKIGAMFILEAIGRPPEHLTEVLQKIINQFAEEKKVKIIEKKVNEPQLMKDKKDFYTNFAEIEFEVESIDILFFLIYKYMPAHIEITYPENITLSNNDINISLNELTRRLHGYDEIARVMQIEKNVLEKKLKSVLSEKGEEEKPKEEKKE